MTLEPIQHKNLLIHILKDIYTQSDIGPLLGFKGGTAAFLFYNLPRFSVDLDFDLLDTTHSELIFEKVKLVLENYGTVKDARKKRYNLFYLLSYNNKQPNAYNIKVEINLRNFGSLYEIKSYLGIAMKVMVKPDMIAHKMVAMYERMGTTHRDIFDTWFFLKSGWPINTKIIELRTNMDIKTFIKKCIELLEKMSDKGILSGMGELLNEEQKKWVKSKLRTEAIFYLKLALETF